jgi:serine/threonine-protein kinase
LQCLAIVAAGRRGQAEPACESSISHLEAEAAQRPYDYRLHSSLGQAYAAIGRNEEAVKAGQHASEMWPVSKDAMAGSGLAIELATILARVGDHDSAIDRLEFLLSIPSRLSLPLLRLDPAWDPLRDHPRFQELLDN